VKAAFKATFLRDVQAIKERRLLSRIREVIEAVEAADSLAEIRNLKSLRGGKQYFRIRIGDYRVGLSIDNETVTFVRFLHRREIYRYFP
jgi:mRNA interferase RelE/StbE